MPVHNHADAGHGHTLTVNFDASGGSLELPGSSLNRKITGNIAVVNTGNASIQNNGGGGAHNNMQPSAVVLKIIKT